MSYASFPIENELTEVSNQINDVLLFILGIGFFAGIALLIYWGVKKIISREMERKKRISVIAGLLLGVLVVIFWNLLEIK
jgi:hypothetical protein